MSSDLVNDWPDRYDYRLTWIPLSPIIIIALNLHEPCCIFSHQFSHTHKAIYLTLPSRLQHSQFFCCLQRRMFLMPQVCFKPITWYIWNKLIGLKRTCGIKNVSMKMEKTLWVLWSTGKSSNSSLITSIHRDPQISWSECCRKRRVHLSSWTSFQCSTVAEGNIIYCSS